jgi:hypothetical protein
VPEQYRDGVVVGRELRAGEELGERPRGVVGAQLLPDVHQRRAPGEADGLVQDVTDRGLQGGTEVVDVGEQPSVVEERAAVVGGEQVEERAHRRHSPAARATSSSVRRAPSTSW